MKRCRLHKTHEFEAAPLTEMMQELLWLYMYCVCILYVLVFHVAYSLRVMYAGKVLLFYRRSTPNRRNPDRETRPLRTHQQGGCSASQAPHGAQADLLSHRVPDSVADRGCGWIA